MTGPEIDLVANLKQEYRDISKTQFWKTLMERIVERYGAEIKTLKVSDGDRFKKTQGYISALEWLLGQPDKVLSGKTEKEE